MTRGRRAAKGNDSRRGKRGFRDAVKGNATGSLDYGWVIVGTCFVSMSFAYGVWYSFPVFFVAILKHFSWSRASTSGIFSLFVLMHGALGPVVGDLVERVGPRRVVTAGALFLSFSLAACSRAANELQLYLTFGVMTSLGVTLIGWVATSTAVRQWFPHRVGTALGFSSSGMGAGILIFAPLTQFLIDRVGWRSTFLILGLLVGGILTPAALLFLRRPAGARGGASREERARALIVDPQWAQTSWTLKKALHTRQFWLLALAFSLGTFTSQGIHLHQVAFLVDHGFSASFGARVLGLVGATSIGGRILWGTVSERIGREPTHSIAYAAIILAVLALLEAGRMETALLAVAYAILFGLGYSIVSPITPAIASDLFQGPTFGRIFGTLTIFHGLGAAVGSWFGGYLHDQLGSYRASLETFMVSAALCTTMVWLAAPRRIRRVPGRARPGPREPELLFVYGTLMSGFPLHSLLHVGRSSRLLGTGRIGGRLYDLGEFPGALPSAGSGTILGELYELTDGRLLAGLDQVEGPLFRRARVRVERAGAETVEAWSYVYLGGPAPRARIPSGDYRRFKETRGRREAP